MVVALLNAALYAVIGSAYVGMRKKREGEAANWNTALQEDGRGKPHPYMEKTTEKMQERLQKIIARAGIASRRHAELLILSGQVRVNGHVVKELGTKADAAKDRIEAAGRIVEAKEGRRVYVLLNKPPGVVAAMSDTTRSNTLRNSSTALP